MRQQQCINCGQRLKPAPSESEYSWVGMTDKQETCLEGATLVDGQWVSNQDHCTDSEWS